MMKVHWWSRVVLLAVSVVFAVTSISGMTLAAGPAAASTHQASTAGSTQVRSELSRMEDVLAQLDEHQKAVRAQLEELTKEIESGSVSPSGMFDLQIAMQTGSQYLEACSNVMSALHQAIMTVARAIKGQ